MLAQVQGDERLDLGPETFTLRLVLLVFRVHLDPLIFWMFN